MGENLITKPIMANLGKQAAAPFTNDCHRTNPIRHLTSFD